MVAGNGSDDFDPNATPNETPEATLDYHRPYVLVLANVCSQLSALNDNLQRALHEVRVAREPIGRDFRDALRDTFKGLAQVGQAGEAVFSK
jgi:hypothetical protein